MIYHAASNRKISYGEIVELVKIPESVPEIPDSELKNPKDFKLIGKDYQRYDVPFKVNGSAIYSGDIHVPDMVYAAIRRAPVNGSQPEIENEAAIRNIKGVLDLVTLKHGIGVVASTMETALYAKQIMEITWKGDPKAKSHNSQEAYAEYEELSKSSKTGSIVTQAGDLNQELPKAQKTI
jgi:isoquinoline 1-oxidoreductase beta subunit